MEHFYEMNEVDLLEQVKSKAISESYQMLFICDMDHDFDVSSAI